MENRKICKLAALKTHPIECEKFTKTFNRSYVSLHVNSVHQEKHPFKCSRPECSKTFNSKQMMRMHVATVHEGHKPFDCTICAKKMSYGNEHKEKQRPFECSKCSKTFNDKRDMKSHLVTVHEGMPWADVWQTSSLIYLGILKNISKDYVKTTRSSVFNPVMYI